MKTRAQCPNSLASREIRHGTIEGGAREKFIVGDIVRIPSRAPHQLVLDGTMEFDYRAVKVKGY
jgi:hypothetical protein